MPQRSRAFCFTINNPDQTTENLDLHWASETNREQVHLQYLIYGSETGNEGTAHYQGFLYFVNPRTPLGIKRLPGFERAHIEIAGDRSAGYKKAIDYCRKGDQPHDEWLEQGIAGPNFGSNGVIVEHGTPPQTQGSRNDINAAIDILQANNYDLTALARQEPEMYVRHYRGFEALTERLNSGSRTFKTKIIWIYGPTGVGKSRFIGDLQQSGIDVYWKVPTNKWYNQYQFQPVMALDDYRRGGGYLLFNDMLRLFDRYPLQVEFKGGCLQFLSKYIIVTSNQSPLNLWEGQTDDRIDQLLRRIEHTIELPNGVSQLRLTGLKQEILDTCGIIQEVPVADLPQIEHLNEIDGERQFNESRV